VFDVVDKLETPQADSVCDRVHMKTFWSDIERHIVKAGLASGMHVAY